MSDPRHAPAAFADRSGRLAIFGGLAVLVGLGLTLLAVAYLALPFAGILPEGSVPRHSVVTGALTYLLLGAIVIWAGLGSILKRRWVRSVMLVLAWSWLLTGASMLLFLAFLLDDVLAASSQGPALTSEVLAPVRLVVLTALFLGGVLLPALFVVVYRDPAVLQTCRQANPTPGWTDGCPVPVLGLSLGLAGAGVFALPMLANPVAPVFGRVVTGWPAALLIVLTAATCMLLALSTFRLEARGWWGATVFLVLIGVSSGLTLAWADPAALLATVSPSGDPSSAAQDLGLAGLGPPLAWATAAFTVASVAYMIGVRRHFPFGAP